MIDLYTWLTPNGRKVSLMLEETGIPYRVVAIDIGRGEQHTAQFRAINPNGKIPAIVDPVGPGGMPLTLFESSAILLYLADKSGMFLHGSPAEYWRTLQWLQFQAANVGPLLGQAQHFVHYAAEKIPYAVDRYVGEARRIYEVLDQRLAQSRFLAGDEYSIADIATWPWMRPWKIQGVAISDYAHVSRWMQMIDARPAVARERQVLADRRREGPLTAEARSALFGPHVAG